MLTAVLLMLLVPLTLTTMLPARIFPPGPPRPPSPPLPAHPQGVTPFVVLPACALGVELFCEGVATFCGLLGVVAVVAVEGVLEMVLLVVGFVVLTPGRPRVSPSACAKRGNIEKSTASKRLFVKYARVICVRYVRLVNSFSEAFFHTLAS